MQKVKQVFLYSPLAEVLRYPEECPFKTQRASIARKRLLQFGWIDGNTAKEVEVEPASVEQLLKFHTEEYLEELKKAAKGNLTSRGLEMGLGTPDTPVFKDMFDYNALACGASITGARLLMQGDARVVFNLLGGLHHAKRDRAAGFCYLNDAVLACMELAGNGYKVLYLDVDAHHGDGVQEAFYDRSDVLTISIHETGRVLFPGTGFEDEIGVGPGLGYSVNIPLPAGTYDEAFLTAFKEVVEPIVGAYQPEVIVAELGMDGLAGDPLTHLSLTNRVFLHVVDFLKGLDKPVLVLGGGGYNIENTVRGWLLCWERFGGFKGGMEWDFSIGGVFLGSGEWVGGLEDPELPVPPEKRAKVEAELRPVLEKLKDNLFPIWGVKTK